MEDILTSNVFSFFKYSNRAIFLKEYLNKLGISISCEEARRAEFLFWHRFDETERGTEPDLVIRVGRYYVLVEAKYFSEFSEGAKETKAQLSREFEGGKSEAEKLGKEFNLIAITADHFYKEYKFRAIAERFRTSLKWTNWQTVASLLHSILQTNERLTEEERDFARDLYDLLDRKNLRDYRGLVALQEKNISFKRYASVFYDARKARFRGGFMGFIDSLTFDDRLHQLHREIFFASRKTSRQPILASLADKQGLSHKEGPIFYKQEGLEQ